jgi:hypothetical protein
LPKYKSKITEILNNNLMNDKNTEYINESIETNNQLIETILRNKGNQMKLKSVIMRILKKIL